MSQCLWCDVEDHPFPIKAGVKYQTFLGAEVEGGDERKGMEKQTALHACAEHPFYRNSGRKAIEQKGEDD